MQMLGSKLKMARVAAEFSTRKVAELLPSYGATISHTTLSNYERDLSIPSMDVLVALSELYRRPIQWFVSGRPVFSGVKYRRHRSGIKISELAKFEAESQRLFDAYFALEDTVDKGRKRGIQYRLNRPLTASEAAQALRYKLRMSELQPIESVFQVLEELGIRVVDLEADRRIDGLSAKLDGRDVVVVNRSKPTARLRLDAAHEMFHLVFGDCDSENDGQIDADEEARSMDAASHFLIPDEVIHDAFKGKSMVRLVKYKESYGVSLAAMVFRASKLGILSPEESRALWIKFSKRGWRQNEPGTVAPDQPWRFEYLIDVAINDHQLSWLDVSKLTGLSEKDLKDRLEIRFGNTEVEMPPRKEVEQKMNTGLRLAR